MKALDGQLEAADDVKFMGSTISPLSPLPLGNATTDALKDEMAKTRATLLEKYLTEHAKSTMVVPQLQFTKPTLTLSTASVPEALSTPDFPIDVEIILEQSPRRQSPLSSRPFRRLDTSIPSHHLAIPNTAVRVTETLTTPITAIERPNTFLPLREYHPPCVPVNRLRSPVKSALIARSWDDFDVALIATSKSRPEVKFIRDDFGLLTPPPVLLDKSKHYSFESELPSIALTTSRSMFDPPPPPPTAHFPMEHPESLRYSRPAPLDTSFGSSRRSRVLLVADSNSPGIHDDDVAVEMEVPSTPLADRIPIDLPPSPAKSRLAPINTAICRPRGYSDSSTTPGSATPTQSLFAPAFDAFTRDFGRQSPIKISKTVRFSALTSPIYTNLRSPSMSEVSSDGVISPVFSDDTFSPASFGDSEFSYNQKWSPGTPNWASPITPIAMHMAWPRIVPAHTSPQVVQESFQSMQPFRPIGDFNPRVARFETRLRSPKKSRARSMSPPCSPRVYEIPLAILPANTVNPADLYDSIKHRSAISKTHLTSGDLDQYSDG
jgi:hypothetical protein